VRPLAIPEGPRPEGEEWSYEVWFGGHPVVLASEGGRIELLDATGADLAERFPELSRLGRALGAVAVVLAGELVVTGADGRPDPDALARRLAAQKPSAVRRASERWPAVFFASDVLWLEGHGTTGLGGGDRRLLLEQLRLAGPHWQTVPRHDDATALLAAARAQGLAGVVARHLHGSYDAANVVAVPAGA
jgi:bifunctional non-homologous end joining protein LigD